MDSHLALRGKKEVGLYEFQQLGLILREGGAKNRGASGRPDGMRWDGGGITAAMTINVP